MLAVVGRLLVYDHSLEMRFHCNFTGISTWLFFQCVDMLKIWVIVTCVVIGVVLAAVALGLGLGFGLKTTSDHLHHRIDCYPEARWSRDKVDRAVCERRGCQYDPGRPAGVPACFVAADSVLGAGYTATNISQRPDGSGFTAELRRNARAVSNATIRPLNAMLDVEYAGENVLHLKVYWSNAISGRDMAIFRFVKMTAAAMMDFWNWISNCSNCGTHRK